MFCVLTSAFAQLAPPAPVPTSAPGVSRRSAAAHRSRARGGGDDVGGCVPAGVQRSDQPGDAAGAASRRSGSRGRGRWRWTRRRCPCRWSASRAGARDVVRRAAEGLRQPLLRRADRVFRLGDHDVAGHHPARCDLRLLNRGRGRRGAAQAGAESRGHQVRDRQPRPSRSRGRREVPAGEVRSAAHHVGRGLRPARSAESDHGSRSATWWPPTG